MHATVVEGCVIGDDDFRMLFDKDSVDGGVGSIAQAHFDARIESNDSLFVQWFGSNICHAIDAAKGMPDFKQIPDTTASVMSFASFYILAFLGRWVVFEDVNLSLALLMSVGAISWLTMIEINCNRSKSLLCSWIAAACFVNFVGYFATAIRITSLPTAVFIEAAITLFMCFRCAKAFQAEPKHVQSRGYNSKGERSRLFQNWN